METGYRASHVNPGFGKMYSEIHKKPFKMLTLSLESRILTEELNNRAGSVEKYLDFACGTGRITGFVSPRAKSAFGVDISPDMLEVARERIPNVRLLQGDITERDSQTYSQLKEQGYFDLITSFRFFLNAEHALRLAILKSLQTLLSENGLFVFNIHKNRTSMRWGTTWLKERLTGRPSESVSFSYMKTLLHEAGFRVESVRSYFYPSYSASLRMPSWYWSLDLQAGKLPWLRQLGHFQMYFCRKNTEIR